MRRYTLAPSPSGLIVASIIVLLGVSGNVGVAYVASSTNYRLEEDVIAVGGGRASSSAFVAEDTIGEPVTATSSSASFGVRAGYQRMQEGYLAVTVPGNLTLNPSIPMIGGGVANAVATWTVFTDVPSGYSMTLQSSSSPALRSGGNTFADYSTAGAVPDHAFSVAAADSEFGVSPEGTDIVQRFRDDGATCGVGGLDTSSACWAPLLVLGEAIASSATGNHNIPAGSVTTLRFRAESGASHIQPSGSYVATATVTILPN
jgi:hypothetical protein